MALIRSDALWAALNSAGLLGPDTDRIRRIEIVAETGQPLTMTVQSLVDGVIVNVVSQLLDGAATVEVERTVVVGEGGRA